ncbi:MAG: type II CAAX endopeptidase family protein [Nitriliruptoraceae bacterium]
MSQTPPTPPPGGPPPPPPPRSADPGGGRRTRTRQRTSLSRVPSPYGLWIALFSVLIFIAPNLVVLGIAGTAALETVAQESTSLIVVNLLFGLILQLVVFGLALLPVLFAGRPFSRLLGPTRTTPAMVGIGLATGFVVAFASYTVNAIAVLISGSTEPVEQQLLQDALAGGVPLILVTLLAIVVAPLAEEVIFRGVLFRALAGRLTVTVGALLSAIVFAVIHFEVVFSQPVALLGLFTIGLLLAVAYHLTGNLLVPIIAHGVFNAISIGLTVLVERLDLEELVEVAALVGLPVPL